LVWFRHCSCPQCRLPAVKDCVIKVYWERTTNEEATARRKSKAVKENKLLKLAAEKLEEEIKSLRAEVRDVK
jgi:hypothetical protein